jgi:hypothetical protein
VAATSILTSVKKMCGIGEDYTAFDPDILTHTNTVFSTLNQLGIGPENGFMIEDATPTWDAFLGDDIRLNNVKTYTYLRVRMMFDPPQTGPLMDSMKEQIREFEWRLSVYREGTGWINPNPADPDDENGGPIDGGSP